MLDERRFGDGDGARGRHAMRTVERATDIILSRFLRLLFTVSPVVITYVDAFYRILRPHAYFSGFS